MATVPAPPRGHAPAAVSTPGGPLAGPAWAGSPGDGRALAAGDLIALASHELKNPLGVVLMGAHLVRERLADHPAADPIDHELLGTVCRAAARMQRLVRDLLDLARADAG